MSQNFVDNLFGPGNTGQTDLQNIENALFALRSVFSGPAAPSNPSDGMFWFDTQNHLLKVYKLSAGTWYAIWDYANNRIYTDTVKTVSIENDAVTEAKIAGLTATFAEINQALAGIGATQSEIDTACDGADAKNSHTHDARKGMAVTPNSVDINLASANRSRGVWFPGDTVVIYVPTGATVLYGKFEAITMTYAATGSAYIGFTTSGTGNLTISHAATGFQSGTCTRTVTGGQEVSVTVRTQLPGGGSETCTIIGTLHLYVGP